MPFGNKANYDQAELDRRLVEHEERQEFQRQKKVKTLAHVMENCETLIRENGTFQGKILRFKREYYLYFGEYLGPQACGFFDTFSLLKHMEREEKLRLTAGTNHNYGISVF